jgi:uncharacterized membrane protein YgdD (TMEM256/DUF423 family)
MAVSSRFPLLAAGVFGLAGVALGAFGTHALANVLAAAGTTQAWETAARYQLIHAVALLGAGVWRRMATGPTANRLDWVARCWSAGILLFSGSLYGYALGGPHPLVFVTPLGGVALLAGWLSLIAAAWAQGPASPHLDSRP